MKKVLSLFSGCGGMDLGFEGGFKVFSKEINHVIHPDWVKEEYNNGTVLLSRTMFKTVFANDIKRDAQSAWLNYFSKRREIPHDIYRLGSIVELVKEHISGNKIFPPNIDVVTGGFPCQDFSVAGKRQGFNSNKSHDGHNITRDEKEANIETRGQLYMWMKNVIEICKPKIFVAENVKGLVNLADAKEIIEHDFRDADSQGYLVVPARVLMAADYGVPQSRQRVIFIGFRKSALLPKAINELSRKNISNEYDPYPRQTHSNIPVLNQLPYVTTGEVLLDLDEPDKSDDLAQQKFSKAKFMGKHCQGQTEINLYGIGPTIRSEHHGNIEYRRLSLEHGGKNYAELENGLDERRLTVRECARIQTFPDEYEFVFSNGYQGCKLNASMAYKIIGNAVPPLLAYHIAKRLEYNWEKYFGDGK